MGKEKSSKASAKEKSSKKSCKSSKSEKSAKSKKETSKKSSSSKKVEKQDTSGEVAAAAVKETPSSGAMVSSSSSNESASGTFPPATPSAKKEQPPTQLEFTKPTINQMPREEDRKKNLPLSTDENIHTREFESFKDELDELNSNVVMLRQSYGSVIRSLVAMFERRQKKKKGAEPKKEVEPDKVNFLTNMSAIDTSAMAERAEELEAADADKYALERFLNPMTREATFKALFEETDELNQIIEPLVKFYNAEGYFKRADYDAQKEVKMKRKVLNKCWYQTRRLAKVVNEVARNYNDDLLNYFRMH